MYQVSEADIKKKQEAGLKAKVRAAAVAVAKAESDAAKKIVAKANQAKFDAFVAQRVRAQLKKIRSERSRMRYDYRTMRCGAVVSDTMQSVWPLIGGKKGTSVGLRT